jgi:hypothetical protein
MAVFILIIGLALIGHGMAQVNYDMMERRDGLWRVKGSAKPYTGQAVWYPSGSTNPVVIRFENGLRVEPHKSAQGPESARPNTLAVSPAPTPQTEGLMGKIFISKPAQRNGASLKAISRTGSSAYLISDGRPLEIILESEAPIGQLISYQVVTQPKLGMLSVSAKGSLIYTPLPGKRGEDSFGFLATNPSGKTSGGLISLMVGVKPVSRETSIYIVMDSSKSMAATSGDLHALKNNELRQSLTEFYGSKEAYDQKVRIISSGSERTFAFLNVSFPSTGLITGLIGGAMSAPPPGRECVVIVFQDEAHPDYHNPYGLYTMVGADGWARPWMVMDVPGTIWAAAPVDRDALPNDITNLRNKLSSGYYKRYCGIVMALHSPEFPAFAKLVDSVFSGIGPFSRRGHNLREFATGDNPKLRLVGSLPHAAGSRYYFDRLRLAAMEAGLAIPNVSSSSRGVSDSPSEAPRTQNKQKNSWSTRG